MSASKNSPQILLVSLLGGFLAGLIANQLGWQELLKPWVDNFFQPVGQIFLRLIFMTIVPLIFASLTLGTLELGNAQNMKKISLITLFYTILASSVSVLIGISLVNFFQPGISFSLAENLNHGLTNNESALKSIHQNVALAKPFAQVLVDLIPKNPLESAVKIFDGEIISFMIFALILGLALVPVKNAQSGKLQIESILDEVTKACLYIIEQAMRLAPLAVFCMIFQTTLKQGIQTFYSLSSFVGLVVLGLALQMFVTYPLMLKFLSSTQVVVFFKKVFGVLIYAFSTASSNATLPKSLHVAIHQLKIKPQIARFVLTIGATANQNGTALFEGITVLFLAQCYGVDLSVAQQIQVVFMSIVAGIGTAGVPGGSLPMIAILLQSVGVPAEGLALILGVDRVLDMCRTTLNVCGDLVIAQIVDHYHDPVLLQVELEPS